MGAIIGHLNEMLIPSKLYLASKTSHLQNRQLGSKGVKAYSGIKPIYQIQLLTLFSALLLKQVSQDLVGIKCSLLLQTQ